MADRAGQRPEATVSAKPGRNERSPATREGAISTQSRLVPVPTRPDNYLPGSQLIISQRKVTVTPPEPVGTESAANGCAFLMQIKSPRMHGGRSFPQTQEPSRLFRRACLWRSR